MLKEANAIVEVAGEKLTLLGDKAIFWERKKMLIVADLHIGKTAHFRNNGIPVPQKVSRKNWENLHRIFDNTRPERVIFLGDLFHSVQNKECETFKSWMSQYSDITFDLVVGNHDILPHHFYNGLMQNVSEQLISSPFVFTHQPLEAVIGDYYNLSGHIHPAVRLKGAAKQALRVPCYFFGEKAGILPAFGAFTGLAIVPVTKKDKVFMVIDKKVIGIYADS